MTAEERPKATITLTLGGSGTVDMVVEFKPEADNQGGPNPITHVAAVVGATAIVGWLKGEDTLGHRCCPHCDLDITAELDASYEAGFKQGYGKALKANDDC